MERHETRRATSLWRAIPGVLLFVMGFFALVMRPSSFLGLLALALGPALVVFPQLGIACVACKRSMKRREYAFSPWIATQIREAVTERDGAALAEIIRGPRIDNRMPTRTTLVLGYCDKCRRVTTIETWLITPERRPRVITEQEMVGPEVDPVVQAGIDVMP